MYSHSCTSSYHPCITLFRGDRQRRGVSFSEGSRAVNTQARTIMLNPKPSLRPGSQAPPHGSGGALHASCRRLYLPLIILYHKVSVDDRQGGAWGRRASPPAAITIWRTASTGGAAGSRRWRRGSNRRMMFTCGGRVAQEPGVRLGGWHRSRGGNRAAPKPTHSPISHLCCMQYN